jgi:CubicO group peptidase (beta-lactamase class C family)
MRGLEPPAEALASDREAHGTHHAVLVVWRGRIVLERYGEGVAAEDTLRSWSMAKSITHALAGLLRGDGRLDPHTPAAVAAWQPPGDPRRRITFEHLLRMVDGLAFVEAYEPGVPNDVIAMLYGDGKMDVATYARAKPAAHEPGTFFNYSSGTTNILTALLGERVGGRAGVERLLRSRLFDPLGIRSAKPRFDAAGTFIGSSYVFATARDFARFGLLYLRDGVWDGKRLLPEGWVDHARTPTPPSAGAYGAHWWLGLGDPNSFLAKGFEGQYLVLDPTRDVLVLRCGRSSDVQRERVEARIGEMLDAFPRLGHVGAP